MKRETQVIMIFTLLALLFYVNISPKDSSDLTEQTKEIVEPYNITINETVPIIDFEGNVVGNITREVNKTIIPEGAKTESNILATLSNLGAIVWPSQEIGGWVIIFLLIYFVVIPSLKWIKELIGFG